ncbi:ROK family protein [Streptomyces sp. NPDC056721]|uniref:ROK family transcriptional regulator n=1 Tax=Streptomyces sp. NPDC056721 TaxID=3345923 RepID=UPI0036A4AD79
MQGGAYHQRMDVTSDRSSPRNRTREEIFRALLGGSITRAHLVEATGLSRSTVNHAVSRLIAEGRVTEDDPEVKGPGSGSGRPAGVLRCVPRHGNATAIDFGHTHVKVAVVDGSGQMVAQRRADLNVDLYAAEAMDAAADMLRDLRQDHEIDAGSTVVVGIPGPLDSASGLVRSPTILSSWVGLDPGQELIRRLELPVHVENDAVLGAYGELRRGAGMGYADFLYVKVSHGIGAGMVLNSEPYRGSLGFAGEIGHTPLSGYTELCRCGRRGCLEAVVSVSSIMAQVAHTHPSQQSDASLQGQPDDPTTRRILNDAGRMLGGVLSVLSNLLNPAALIIGGELGATGGPLLEGIDATVKRDAQPAIAASMDVLPAQLGENAELVGAAVLAGELAQR